MVELFSLAAATDFALKVADSHASPYPVVIAESDCTKLWYRKDDIFKVPRGEVWGEGCRVVGRDLQGFQKLPLEIIVTMKTKDKYCKAVSSEC